MRSTNRRLHALPQPAHVRELRERWLPSGLFGVDKRGAPVMYGRLGLADTAGFAREVGMDMYIAQEFYTVRPGSWIRRHRTTHHCIHITRA